MTEEYFDVVNENNQVIGQEVRRIVHNSGLWHRGVHVFLFTPDRRLLVQKRSQTRDTFPGTLDCSVSEHLKPGESYLAAALRGLLEELGVEDIPLTRLVQFKMNYGPHDNEFSELYEGVWDNIPITIDPYEVQGIAYHTISELEELITWGQVPFAPWFVQLLGWYTGRPTKMKVIMVGMSKEQLIEKLRATQRQFSIILESLAENQDWQPDTERWSFRFIAAHMATVEEQCFLNRVKRFSTEKSPHFEHYDNTGRDFNQFELINSLRAWAALRRELLDMVSSMPENTLHRCATHSTRGTQTLLELLHIVLEHDQEHLQEVQQMTSEFQSKTQET